MNQIGRILLQELSHRDYKCNYGIGICDIGIRLCYFIACFEESFVETMFEVCEGHGQKHIRSWRFSKSLHSIYAKFSPETMLSFAANVATASAKCRDLGARSGSSLPCRPTLNILYAVDFPAVMPLANIRDVFSGLFN